MRIVAGKFKSRSLKSLKGNQTRPTLDKVKESIFSRIGPYFEGGKVLDLFAGSGSIGLECLSRGMEYCVFVDKDYEAIQIIRANVESLQVQSQSEILRCDFMQALTQCSLKKLSFDVIYLDPPYLKQQNEKIIQIISNNNLLNENGLIICESLKEDVFLDEICDLRKEKEVVYGISRISYYRKEKKL